MKMEETANIFVDGFLQRNSFKNVCPNKWASKECMVTILPDCYQIDFTNYDGDWTLYTDSWSIPHLVGVLTWHDLLDRNYSK
jgi:hypothetical protein